jgi:hypothetical protein
VHIGGEVSSFFQQHFRFTLPSTQKNSKISWRHFEPSSVTITHFQLVPFPSMISSHISGSSLQPFGEVAFTGKCTAAFKQGVLPTSVQSALATLTGDTRQVLELMMQPSLKDRAWFSKEWREAFDPVWNRATLRDEAGYVKGALDELQRLTENPLELLKRGANYLHFVMQQLGLEPPLTSESQKTIAWDWAADVCKDLEDILSEADELNEDKLTAVSYQGLQEEKEDQKELYKNMANMVERWKSLRYLVFCDPTAGVEKQVRERVLGLHSVASRDVTLSAQAGKLSAVVILTSPLIELVGDDCLW